MRSGILVVLCASLLVAGAPQASEGQEAQPQLQYVQELQIKPNMIRQFEAAHALRNERMAEVGVSFLARGAVSESLVYRFVTPIGDLAGMQRLVDEMGEMGSRPPDAPNGDAAIDHIDSYLRFTRPNLSYTPDNPRLETSEWGAMRRIRIFAQMGKVGEIADVIRDVVSLYEKREVAEGFLVYTQTAGADAPLIEVQVFGSSLADVYATGDRLDALLGAEMGELNRRVVALSRRIEVDNFDLRQDLGYQPAN